MTRRQRFSLFAMVLMSIGLVGGVASPASATEFLQLELTAQPAEPPVFDPATSTLRLHLVGTGDSNVLGSFSVDTRVVQHVQQPCATTTTQNIFTAEDGELFMSGNDYVCPDGRGGSIIFGQWTITGGTGAYADATGRGARYGTFDGRVSTVTFFGVLHR